MRGSQLAGACVVTLANTRSLRELYADELRVNRTELAQLNRSSLQVLELDGADLDDRAVPSLLALPALHRLVMPNAKFSKRARAQLQLAGIALE